MNRGYGVGNYKFDLNPEFINNAPPFNCGAKPPIPNKVYYTRQIPHTREKIQAMTAKTMIKDKNGYLDMSEIKALLLTLAEKKS